MPKFQIANNERTSFYEVHVAGCAHLPMGLNADWRKRKYAYVNEPGEAESALAFAVKFEAESEGCLTRFGPCAKEGGKPVQCPECHGLTGMTKGGVTVTLPHVCRKDYW